MSDQTRVGLAGCVPGTIEYCTLRLGEIGLIVCMDHIKSRSISL